MFKFLKSFTLAETLIVMGVIGVVAALTLPNLNQSTNNKEKVVKLQKIYSNLNDAYGRAAAVYGPIDEWGLTPTQAGSKKAADRITEFMKISKNCGYQSSCFVQSRVNNLDGTLSNWIPNPGYDFILADGTAISIESPDNNDISVEVDLDGPNKGRHQLGTDHFTFILNSDKKEDGFIPYSQDNVGACIGSNGEKCTAWVILNGNMDYIKCPGKLSATVTTCK